MELKRLSLKDRALFVRYLRLKRHELSAYSFINIYIWKCLFNISWAVIDKCLCVFFRDKMGCFLYLPPQGKEVCPGTIEKVFIVLDKFNKNKELSRIENIEDSEKEFYRGLGYSCKDKYPEYLCRRQDLAELKGNAFKSKRSSVNYFSRHYQYEYLEFVPAHAKECLSLYDAWSAARAKGTSDVVYKGMLSDGRACLKLLLDNSGALNVTGRVIKIDNKVKAFTFGFELNNDTFVVLYEITDLSVAGLAQFIFREFSGEQNKYKYINIMDDSGLANLEKVKLSYRPARLIPAYIATRKNA